MATEDHTPKRGVPPYVPYVTFKNYLESLRAGIPAQIDRSVMSSYSGAIQSWLTTSLKYFNLITDAGIPTDALREVVQSEGEGRQRALTALLKAGYPFLFTNAFDLGKATPAMLDKAFTSTGATGDTVNKSKAFFIALAKDAGIDLSPHLLQKFRKTRSTLQRGRRAALGQDMGQGGSQVDKGEELEVPSGGMVHFKLPIPQKREGIICLPQDIDADDWAMLKAQLDAYVARLIKQQGA